MTQFFKNPNPNRQDVNNPNIQVSQKQGVFNSNQVGIKRLSVVNGEAKQPVVLQKPVDNSPVNVLPRPKVSILNVRGDVLGQDERSRFDIVPNNRNQYKDINGILSNIYNVNIYGQLSSFEFIDFNIEVTDMYIGSDGSNCPEIYNSITGLSSFINLQLLEISQGKATFFDGFWESLPRNIYGVYFNGFNNLSHIKNMKVPYFPYFQGIGIDASSDESSLLDSLDISLCTTMQYLVLPAQTNLKTLDISKNKSLNALILAQCTFTTDQVNRFLIDFDNNGLSGGYLVLQMVTPTPPTGLGIVSKTNLINKGWSVYTD